MVTFTRGISSVGGDKLGMTLLNVAKLCVAFLLFDDRELLLPLRFELPEKLDPFPEPSSPLSNNGKSSGNGGSRKGAFFIR